jgi:hypothetical protein
VDEVSLRCGRLLGMSAQPFGAPWLLIEMCAWSLVTEASAGCSRGRCQPENEYLEESERA